MPLRFEDEIPARDEDRAWDFDLVADPEPVAGVRAVVLGVGDETRPPTAVFSTLSTLALISSWRLLV